MFPFTIFIPLFLLIPCIVYLMDLSLRPHDKYGWELATPTFGLELHHRAGFSSYMRAVQMNPVAVSHHRNRPCIARQFPIRRAV
jgi:hypothetical protein